MATTEEIARRVEQADAARSAKRAAAAQRVGELAQRRAALAEQLDDIERQLGDELAAAQEVMDVDELASFTDVPAAALSRWLTARTTRKPGRTRRKRTTGSGAGEHDTRSGGSTARTAPTAQAAKPDRVPSRASTVNGDMEQVERVPVEVG